MTGILGPRATPREYARTVRLSLVPLRDHEALGVLAALLGLVEEYRVALQDVQGIALNGTDTADTDAERLDAIDRRVTEELS